MKKIINVVLRSAFVVAVIAAIVGVSLSLQLRTSKIAEGFERNHVSQSSGFDRFDLNEIARRFSNYLRNDDQDATLSMTFVTVTGEQSLFTPAELNHMSDVKRLMQWILMLSKWSLLVILARLLVAADRSALKSLGNDLMTAAGILQVSLPLLAVASMIDFEPLFRDFHAIAFPRGNWQFDPATSMLLALFPENFWSEAAQQFFISAGVLSTIATGAGFLLRILEILLDTLAEAERPGIGAQQ